MNDPFKLETLIAWLQTKNPDQTYEYTNSHHCLLAQYFNEHGHRESNVCPTTMSSKDSSNNRIQHPLPPHFDDISHGPLNSSSKSTWTFGAALKRALWRANHGYEAAMDDA